jgi:DNA recombination protein RmuC
VGGGKTVNAIWLIWSVLGGSVLLVLVAVMAVLWQHYLNRDLQAACAECRGNLKRLREQRDQLEEKIQELSAGLRAEKAHVAQLQRQVELLREL